MASEHRGHADQPTRVPSSLTAVASVPTHAEADLIVGMLRAYGVAAVTSADDMGGAYPSLMGVRVLVDAADVQLATELLDQGPS
jgi:hypothetical protein